MTRYILEPFVLQDRTEGDSFALIPTEGFLTQPRKINLPKGLVSFTGIYSQVKRKNRSRKLLRQLNKADICRNKEGHVYSKGTTTNVDFNDAVINSCGGNFKDCYEDFYCLLRANGITF